MGEMRNAYKILIGKPEGKGQFGRSRHRRKDNTGMDFREMLWGNVNWIHLAHDREQLWALVNTVMNLGVP
jgi:hypothetical protein